LFHYVPERLQRGVRRFFLQIDPAYGIDVRKLAGNCANCIPPAASKTILARSTLRAEALRARARDSSKSRCSVFSTTGRATRIVFAPSIVKTQRE
jgi:hypothetical protein